MVINSAINYAVLTWVNDKFSPLLITSTFPIQVMSNAVISQLFFAYDLQVRARARCMVACGCVRIVLGV